MIDLSIKECSKESLEFEDWINEIMKAYSEEDVKAYVFNISSNGKNDFSTSIVATSRFDEEDSNFVSDEIWASRGQTKEYHFRADGLQAAKQTIINYVKDYQTYMNRNGTAQHGQYWGRFVRANGVVVGLADGDLEIITRSLEIIENGYEFYVSGNDDGLIGSIADGEEQNFYFDEFDELENKPKEYDTVDDGRILFVFNKELKLREAIERLKGITLKYKDFFDNAIKLRESDAE